MTALEVGEKVVAEVEEKVHESLRHFCQTELAIEAKGSLLSV